MSKKFILQPYKNFRGIGGSRRSHLKVAGFRATEFMTADLANDWQNKLLWVNDRPENNVYERKAMESMDLEFTPVLSTDEALQMLGVRRFAAIISDIGRKEEPRDGFVLLEAVCAKDKTTPFFYIRRLACATPPARGCFAWRSRRYKYCGRVS
jgi:hypothetical protein